MAFKGLTITSAGERLTAAITGNRETISISKVVIGDGFFSGNQKDIESVVQPLFELNPDISVEKNKVYINAQIDSKSYIQDFYFREFGVYVKTADGKQILYAYDNASEDAELIPISNEVAYEKRLRFCVGFSSDLIMNVEIAGGMYALQIDFENHLEENQKSIDSIDKRIKQIEVNGVISGDTLPVGGQFQFEGDVVPTGYKEVTPPFSNPNLSFNSDFKVWQRGTSFPNIMNGSYCADRWRIWKDLTTGTANVEKVSDGLKVTGDFEGHFNVYQILDKDENENLIGQDITITKCINGIETSYKSVISVVGNTSYISLCSINDLKSNDVINWVKVELGEIATPFVPRSNGEELTLCKRYYETILVLGDMVGLNDSTNGITGYIVVPFIPTVEKRVKPSFSFEDLANNVGYCTRGSLNKEQARIFSGYTNSSFELISDSGGKANCLRAIVHMDAEIY